MHGRQNRCIQRGLKEIYRLEGVGVDRRIILKWNFKTWDGSHGMDGSDRGKGKVAGACG
jgi:hypothetical protein